jgi:hypothetical protein
MRLSHVLAVLLLTAAVLSPALFADIVITKDDMILNGKIIEDKKPAHIIFANYHGTFTIKYKMIKKIHRTESFEDDIEIFRDMRKEVSEAEIKKNYIAGEEKLEKLQWEEKKNRPAEIRDTDSFVLILDVFCDKNFGKLNSVLPYSAGAALSGEFPVNYLKKYYIHGIDTELGFYNSVKGERSISGLNLSAGPLLQLPVTLSGYSYKLNLSALIGTGWYDVKNDETAKEASAVKWNLTVHAGPVFKLGSAIISTQLRLNYIHDGTAPMQGAV